MTTSLTITGNKALSLAENDPFAAGLASEVGNHAKYLSFDGNTGDYLYGPEDDKKEIAHGTKLALDIRLYKRGFVCWNDSKLVEEIMATLFETAPSKGDLIDHGPYKGKRDGWKEQKSFNLLDGETGDLFEFKTASAGGRRGVQNFLDNYKKVYKTQPGMLPIVKMSTVSFDTKDDDGNKAGKKYAPVFSIEGWVSQTDYDDIVADGAAAQTDESGEDDESNYIDQDAILGTNTQPAPEPEPEPVVEAVVEKVTAPVADAAPAGRRGKKF